MDATLEGTLASAWALLARAAADPRHPCRVVQLATVGLDGAPRLRSVILRGIEPAMRVLRLHTDRRSAKAAEIAVEPRVALLAWEARARAASPRGPGDSADRGAGVAGGVGLGPASRPPRLCAARSARHLGP
jgi:pyridoxine/pyridoxamine 5'-phosphate oxidase